MSSREFNYICPECSNPIRWYDRSQQWGCDTCGWTGDEIPTPDMNAASQDTQIVESQETPSSDDEPIDNPDDPEAVEFPIDAYGDRINFWENRDEYMYWYRNGVERWRVEEEDTAAPAIHSTPRERERAVAESRQIASRRELTPGSSELAAMARAVRAPYFPEIPADSNAAVRYRVPRRRASMQSAAANSAGAASAAAPEGKIETMALESKVVDELQVALTELHKKLGSVLYFEIIQPVSSSILRSKIANDIIMLEDTLISTLLQDKDNIVFQLDKEPFTAVVTTVQTLSNLLYNPEYLKHTKYQCLKENDALYYQESDIVISNDSMSNLPIQYKYNRHQYKFVSGTFIGIFGGLLLRSQLEDIFRNIERSPNSSPKHFLYHIHDDIRGGPIISADKVSWSIKPSSQSRSEQYFSQPWQRDYTEAHRPAGSMVSADHCQPGSKSLITITPVRTPAPEKTTNKRKSSKTSGKKTKRHKGGRKKRTRRKKWSNKYKKLINCKHPKGFSQKQYCKYGRKTKRRRRRKKKTKRRRKGRR
uniref:Uncharacterized protein n=1 Tax=viral metagenome TaxID=1070528 RepID=A0A6C0BYH6_9ZZZZ